MKRFIPSIKVALYLIADEFDLDRVTEMIGVIPTETRTRESFPRQSISAGIAKSEWSVEIMQENCIAVSTLFEELLMVLKGKEDIIRRVCEDFCIDTGFLVVIHMKDGDSPEVILPREVISFAAAIRAEIGFDIYCYE